MNLLHLHLKDDSITTHNRNTSLKTLVSLPPPHSHISSTPSLPLQIQTYLHGSFLEIFTLKKSRSRPFSKPKKSYINNNMTSVAIFLLFLLVPSLQQSTTVIVSAHHEPKCPDGTSSTPTDPLVLTGSSNHCNCLSTHELGMEVTCSNMKIESVVGGLEVFKNKSDLDISTLILQLNYIPTVANDTFYGLSSVKEIQFRLNRIKNFSENAFRGIEDTLEKLTILEFFWVSFKYKTLDKIPVEALKPLKNLKELFISSANIRNIPGRAFSTLANLETLRLMSFTLNKLYDDSFFGLDKLKDLSVVTNFLKEIPPLTFSQMPNLEHLFLSLKSFREITTDHFSYQRYLRELSFNNSGVETIADGSFSKLSNSLKILSLKGNQLSTLPGAISDLTKLTHLDLSSNTIFELTTNSLSGLMSLEHIILSFNIIKNIRSNVLADSKWLKHIDLRANLLTQIPDNFFQTFRNLEELDLSKNFVSDLPDLTFYQNDKLKKLDLSNNNLKSISATAFKSLGKSLIYLDLSHNYLPDLPAKTFSEFENLVFLNVSHNNMTTFDIDELQGSEETLRFIGMANNPWHCDCKMRRFRDWYKYWSSQLSHSDKYVQEINMHYAKCHTPINLAGVPLLYPPRNAFTYCENASDSDANGNKIKMQYHLKGTKDVYNNNNNNDEEDDEIDNKIGKEHTRRQSFANAFALTSDNTAIQKLSAQTRASLVLSIMAIFLLIVVILGKFIFASNSSTLKQRDLDDESSPGATRPTKLGNFLSALPVNLKNGHIPEDKQTIANSGYPMGTVA